MEESLSGFSQERKVLTGRRDFFASPHYPGFGETDKIEE
jgi:hypothetical protein